MTYVTCTDCHDYMDRRHPVVVPALAKRRAETGESSQQILDRYMDGVHDRHLSGLPILPDRAAVSVAARVTDRAPGGARAPGGEQ